MNRLRLRPKKKSICKRQQYLLALILPVLYLCRLAFAPSPTNNIISLLEDDGMSVTQQHTTGKRVGTTHIPSPHDEDAEDSAMELLVATIGRPPQAVCRPGLSSSAVDNTEWCVDPVNGSGLIGTCSFRNNSWRALQAHVHPTFEGGDNDYQEQFESNGRIGIQQDEGKMNGIYAAHLSALRSLCRRRAHHQGGRVGQFDFGLVLESDVMAKSGRFQNWTSAFIAKFMASHPKATVFNLAPTTAICSSESNERLKAIQRGQCVVPWQLKQWGATAVGYNLTTACSDSFFQVQEALVGCLPSDLGLYTGAGGFQARTVALPLFEVTLDGKSSNAKDTVHANLKNVYAETEQLWPYLFSHGVNCVTTKKNRTTGDDDNNKIIELQQDWKWTCTRDRSTGGYYSRLRERSRLGLWWSRLVAA